MSKDDGGPAFSQQVVHIPNDGTYPASRWVAPGITKREWFAGMALSAMQIQIVVAEPAAAFMAESAYIIADAMLKESEK